MTHPNYLSFYFPFWSADLKYRCTKKGPFLFVTKLSQKLIVKRFCQAGAKAGVKIDMPLALAKALIPNANIFDFEPQKDFAALFRIALWSNKFAPLVGIDDALLLAFRDKNLEDTTPLQYGITLDLNGTEKLYPDKLKLLETLCKKFRRSGITAKCALGETIGQAWAFSRFPEHRSIHTLPFKALRISNDTLQALHEIGLSTVGELINLPRKSIISRFGPLLLKRLDQLSGALPEKVQLLPLPKNYAVSKTFEVPLINHENLASAVILLLKKLCKELKQDQKQVGAFVIELKGEKGLSHKEVTLHSAIHDFRQFTSIIFPLVESINIPGPVHTIAISVKAPALQVWRQTDLLNQDDGDLLAALEELLNMYLSRLGSDQVYTASAQPSHIPERSFAYKAIGTPIIKPPPLERPSKIFSQPEKASTISLLPDGPPVSINWRGLRSKVLSATGPERICEEWWHASLELPISERDYYKVQDECGRWLWIFRDKNSLGWFVHGVWW